VNTPLKLTAGNASAALLVLDDGRYLLQLRDDKPGIWYPGHWGCFGGAADPGEEAVATLRRELREELALEVHDPEWFTRFVFDCGRSDRPSAAATTSSFP
jgi:8-oxo-dGTP pyrophosphatase MutT (NUDIX family)